MLTYVIISTFKKHQWVHGPIQFIGNINTCKIKILQGRSLGSISREEGGAVEEHRETFMHRPNVVI